VELLLEVRHRLTNQDTFVSLGANAETFVEDTTTLAAAAVTRLT
jgi:hypothetical protein